MLAEVKFEVERPETVSAPLEFERPEPSKLLNDDPPIFRFVVLAVTNDEYEVDDEYEDENKPPPEILFPPMAMLPDMLRPPAPMVEASVVEVAVKFPNVGVVVETKFPEELVDIRELTATPERLRVFKYELPETVRAVELA